ncbi:MAG: molybdate ABC transporter substrate-binding protein [Limisphaerales bacterium]
MATNLPAAEVTVFAAASLTDALKETTRDYERQSGDRIFFNFGASSFLARQIEEGAPADLFFSADEAKMDALQKRGRIEASTRRSLLSNALVIVVAVDSPLRLASARDLAGPGFKTIALADPQTVPAGIYSREYLAKLGLWSAVKRKVVPTDNVRAALAAVESGNVDAGMVYRTDAAISKKIRVACAVPIAEGPAIRYPVAVVKDSPRAAAAEKFLTFLASVPAEKVFKKYGFIVRPGSAE